MRAKLILLMCAVSLPGLLMAGAVDSVINTALPFNHPDLQKRLADEIAAAEAALEHKELSVGAQSPETADAASVLAELYLKAGDYERASPLIDRALKIRRASLGDEDRATAASLHQLAQFREELGAFAEAEALYRKALGVRRAHADGDAAATLHALGRLLSKTDNVVEAEKLLREALLIEEQRGMAKDVQTAHTLFELAKIEARNNTDSESAALIRRAYEIFKITLGEHSPDTEDARSMMDAMMGINETVADMMEGIGGMLKQLGEEKPQPVKRRLPFSGPFNAREAQKLSDAAELLQTTGDADDRRQALLMHERSLSIRQRVLGAEHPKTLESLQRLGLAELNRRQYDRALLYARKAMFAQAQLLQRIFSFTDEQHRLAYQSTVSPYSVFASLPEVPAGDLATAVLRFKGAVLDSLLAEPGLGAGGLTASATPSQMASVLAPDALLIEMIRYPHRLDGTRIEDRYGALVIASNEEPKWISLGGANAIDENIELYRKSVRYESSPRNVQAYNESERDSTNESALHLILRSLHDQVWMPIEKALPAGSKTMILSPDGALNFISFATLLNAKDEFLIEKYSIRYVASGRDLLREGEGSTTELLAVFGDPDFRSQPKLIARSEENRVLAMRSSEMPDFETAPLTALPGTNKECTGLNAKAKALGKPTEVFLGAHASEAQLREINSPRILHLATHGFFLPESKDEHDGDEAQNDPGTPVILKNPMHRSGLALAGAENTLAAWAKNQVTPRDNDGIVTAEEVGALKLRGTWLVVLSACDTGAGEAKAGEGVLGLRRGFIQAGAQNLLMTLWSISDETTVQIMLDFYDRAFASGNAPQSLQDVQREWLVKLRKENGKEGGLLYAVNRAGPFIMSSQGNPELSATSTESEREEVPFSLRKLPKPGSLPYISWRKACVDRPMPPDSPAARRWSNTGLSILSKG